MGKHSNNTIKKQTHLDKISRLILYLKGCEGKFNITEEAKFFGLYGAPCVALKQLGYVIPAGPHKGAGSKFNNRKKLNNLPQIAEKVANRIRIIGENYGKSPYIKSI